MIATEVSAIALGHDWGVLSSHSGRVTRPILCTPCLHPQYCRVVEVELSLSSRATPAALIVYTDSKENMPVSNRGFTVVFYASRYGARGLESRIYAASFLWR